MMNFIMKLEPFIFSVLIDRLLQIGLMTFGVDGLRQIRFTQRETLRRVNVSIDLSKVPVSRELRALMNQCLGGNVDLETSQLFGELWQDRVRKLILEHGEDREVFSVVQGR